MIVSIELVSKENSNAIYKFEKENREYFERSLPSRGDAYYDLNNFEKIIEQIIYSINTGASYMYVIKNQNDKLIGRVNLHKLQDDSLKVAELGYRISKNESNKGYATSAVEMVLLEAFDRYHFDKIVAGTASDNEASKKVLIKNGFTFLEEIKEDVEVNGRLVDSHIFEKYR
ncbi:MAG: GNAT family N-acetyltransferase [Clostridiales bacterium]|nr:MAG: GNAT family N-acetyltransferase [Clostridiales bacterium]